MADFSAADLRGARFERTDLAGAEFSNSDLRDAWVRRAIGGDPSPWDPLGLPWDRLFAERDLAVLQARR